MVATYIDQFTFVLNGQMVNGNDNPIQQDCWVYSLRVVNPLGGSTAVVTIQDGQGTPVILVPSASILPGGWISDDYHIPGVNRSQKDVGRLMKAGIKLSCNQSNISLYMIGRLA